MKGVSMPSQASAAGDLDWQVSRTCDNGQCIKVARAGKFVMIGNTSKPEGPVSEFTVEEWRHFLAGVKQGDFDGIA
jgi:predicted secreted Zn-dependent protease